jgi:hypothetical protein
MEGKPKKIKIMVNVHCLVTIHFFSERLVSDDCSLCSECSVFSESLLGGDCSFYG